MKKKIVFIALVFAITFSAVGAYGQNASNPGAQIGNFLNSIFGNSEKSSASSTQNTATSGTNLLFPADGVTLGKTTVNELMRMGTRSRYIDDETSQPYLYYEVKGIEVWYDEKTNLADHYYIVNYERLPDKWVSTGMSFENSYDQWLDYARRYNLGVKVEKSPQKGSYDGHSTFVAELVFSYIAEGVLYEIELNFNYSDGDKSSDRNTLYSIRVRGKPTTQTTTAQSTPAQPAPVQPDKAAYDRGRTAYDQKNYDRAITEFTEAIRLNPNYELAFYFRAEAYTIKDDYDKALADFTQAIRLSPNDTDNYNERGYVYIIRNEYDRAIADFNQTLKIDPNNTDAKEGLELARQRKQNSTPAAAPVQPTPPATAYVNPNFIPPSVWNAGDGDAPGVTKRIFKTREAIAGQERDVLTLEVTFPRQNGNKWATFTGPWEEPYLSRLRTGSGIRFKVFGDGKRWIIQFQTRDTSSDWCGFEAEIKTTNNRVVDINIPYSSLKQGTWGKKASWNKNNIVGISIQRNSSDSGTSTLKVFDFEVY